MHRLSDDEPSSEACEERVRLEVATLLVEAGTTDLGTIHRSMVALFGPAAALHVATAVCRMVREQLIDIEARVTSPDGPVVVLIRPLEKLRVTAAVATGAARTSPRAASREALVPTKLIADEHRRLDRLFTSFQDYLCRHDIRGALHLFSFFRIALRRHLRWEDESLAGLPGAAASTDQGAGDRLMHREQHTRLDRLATEILTFVSVQAKAPSRHASGLSACLSRFERLFREHCAPRDS